MTTLPSCPSTITSKNIQIPIFGAQLTELSVDQLHDLLVYIESLRANDGTSDARFANLQNDIIKELAQKTLVSKTLVSKTLSVK